MKHVKNLLSHIHTVYTTCIYIYKRNECSVSVIITFADKNGSFSYLQVMITYMRAWMCLKVGQIQPLVSMVTDRVMMEKNSVSTFSRLFFIRSFYYLQVTITCIRARTSSNFGLIGPPTAELVTLERLKKKHRLIMGNRMSPLFIGCS